MSRNPDNPPIDSLFEFAANPLNSLNPPPRDLPDLLDSLLRSDGALRNKIDGCDKVARELTTRVDDLRGRLEGLRRKFPQWRSDNPQRLQRSKEKTRLAFEAQEAVYARMLSQITFLQSIAHIRLPLRLEDQRVNCRHVFDAFLGSHHDHPGVEIANSAHLHCVDGCRWYFEHGPYEWSKKPFSNEWWAALNQTDWDWVKVRKHVEDLIKSISDEYLRAADDFQRHLQEFIPLWFWRDCYPKWGLQSRFRIVDGQDGAKQILMNVFVSYPKSQQEMDQEHAQKMAALIKQREEEGLEDAAAVDPKCVVIESLGDYYFNNDTIFDGIMTVANWDQAVRHRKGSWLNHWGYDKWIGKRSRGVANQ